MPTVGSDVGSHPVTGIPGHQPTNLVRSWSVRDFVLIWLGGFVGTGVMFAIGSLIGGTDLSFVLALAGQYVGNLGVLWLLKRSKEDGDLRFSVEGKDLLYVGLGFALQVALAALFFPLSQLLFPDGRPPQEVAETLANADSPALMKMAVFLAAVILAPVTEEIVFRGVLLRSIEHRGRRFAIVITALAFSAVHVLGLQVDRMAASAAVVLPPLFLLGLALAWLTLRNGRLGPAIFLHSGWNLLAAIILLLPPELLEGVG